MTCPRWYNKVKGFIFKKSTTDQWAVYWAFSRTGSIIFYEARYNTKMKHATIKNMLWLVRLLSVPMFTVVKYCEALSYWNCNVLSGNGLLSSGDVFYFLFDQVLLQHLCIPCYQIKNLEKRAVRLSNYGKYVEIWTNTKEAQERTSASFLASAEFLFTFFFFFRWLSSFPVWRGAPRIIIMLCDRNNNGQW